MPGLELGMELGNHCVLRRTNIDKVSELTGHSVEQLTEWLDHYESQGATKVRIPMVPREIRAMQS